MYHRMFVPMSVFVVCALLLTAPQANAGIPEQFVAEHGLKAVGQGLDNGLEALGENQSNGLTRLADGIDNLSIGLKFLAVGIALSGLFVGLGLAAGKRKECG